MADSTRPRPSSGGSGALLAAGSAVTGGSSAPTFMTAGRYGSGLRADFGSDIVVNEPRGLSHVKALHSQLSSVVGSLNEKVSGVLQKQEQEFLRAYRAHMYSVQKELSSLKAKSDDAALQLQKNERIRQLEAERDWYRTEALRLDEFVTALKADVAFMRERLTAVEEDRLWLEARLRRHKRAKAQARLRSNIRGTLLGMTAGGGSEDEDEEDLAAMAGEDGGNGGGASRGVPPQLLMDTLGASSGDEGEGPEGEVPGSAGHSHGPAGSAAASRGGSASVSRSGSAAPAALSIPAGAYDSSSGGEWERERTGLGGYSAAMTGVAAGGGGSAGSSTGGGNQQHHGRGGSSDGGYHGGEAASQDGDVMAAAAAAVRSLKGELDAAHAHIARLRAKNNRLRAANAGLRSARSDLEAFFLECLQETRRHVAARRVKLSSGSSAMTPAGAAAALGTTGGSTASAASAPSASVVAARAEAALESGAGVDAAIALARAKHVTLEDLTTKDRVAVMARFLDDDAAFEAFKGVVFSGFTPAPAPAAAAPAAAGEGEATGAGAASSPSPASRTATPAVIPPPSSAVAALRGAVAAPAAPALVWKPGGAGGGATTSGAASPGGKQGAPLRIPAQTTLAHPSAANTFTRSRAGRPSALGPTVTGAVGGAASGKKA